MQQQIIKQQPTDFGVYWWKCEHVAFVNARKKKTNFTHTFQFNFIKFFFIRIFSCSFNLSEKG